jgi:putative heme-binding domain-containing protein
MPVTAAGWSIELVGKAPQILYPTAIVAAPDRTVYLGSDPMDMTGPATVPLDRVLRIKDGRVRVFAEGLWSVMGLEWVDGTLYVVHAPFLSAFRDTDGDGTADVRTDLVTGLGPRVPGFNGINDHIASGVRLGIDGFLYIAVGDKGIPRAVGRDGKAIQLRGGGVIRVKPDGTGLEVVSSGECNPLSVALSASGEIFTYGNDDDSKTWPNSLTHHIVGGHYGYPYQFRTARERCLPIMAGSFGGAGAQGICYNEDRLPAEYRGNLFFCDWGLQSVLRFELRKAGGTFALARRTELVKKGNVTDFRPFSLAVADDGDSLLLVDWAFSGWLATGQQTGRLYRLRYTGRRETQPAPRPAGDDVIARIKALDHPALSVRMESQRVLARKGSEAVPLLVTRLKGAEPELGRVHALWALDAIGGRAAREAVVAAVDDLSPRVRLQAARSVGIRGDQVALRGLVTLLKDRDAAVRREAAIALGKLGNPGATDALYAALDEADVFACWSVRQAIRRLEAWDEDALVAALLDDRRRESALRLADESWALPVVEALAEAFRRSSFAPVRARITAILAGLYRTYPEWSGLWFGTNPLVGPVPQKTVDWSPDGMRAVLGGLALALRDADRDVRYQAIVGISQAGRTALPELRAALARERDPDNQIVLTGTLAALTDSAAVPMFLALLNDAARAEGVRHAALEALAHFRGPDSLRARLALIYDDKTPPGLVAAALPDLGRLGILPANDLAAFFDNAAPAVRAAALLSLNVKKPLPDDVVQSLLGRLDDRAAEVRKAAMLAAVPLRIKGTVPRMLAIARDLRAPDREAAVAALCALPDERALPVYLEAIQHGDPARRSAAESALVAIRSSVAKELIDRARSGALSAPAAECVERVLARFDPIVFWRVIGPFPRATPQIFLGEPAIDWRRSYTGADGRPIHWSRRQADAAKGRVDLSEFQGRPGRQSSLGYDSSTSPDLCAFAFAEIDTDRPGPALLLLGSSGGFIVTVNETLVHQYSNPAGRAYRYDTDRVRIELAKGRNRIMIASRQGIGDWCFSVQIGKLPPRQGPSLDHRARVEALRDFALRRDGDVVHGQHLFFDTARAGCSLCHSVGALGSATIGPNLSNLASKYDRAEIIRSVLEPSSRIALGYQTVTIATHAGQIQTGVVHAETKDHVELADGQGRLTPIPRKDIELTRQGGTSIMPAEPADSLSASEFADLISYLCSLKAPAGTSLQPRP